MATPPVSAVAESTPWQPNTDPSSSTEVGDLASRLLASLSICDEPDPNDDWPTLHEWAFQYRRDHSLTLRAFIALLGLEHCSTYNQFLSRGGRDRVVPRRPHTRGAALRNALTCLKERGTSPPASQTVQERQAVRSISNVWAEEGKNAFPGVLVKEEPGDILRVFHRRTPGERAGSASVARRALRYCWLFVQVLGHSTLVRTTACFRRAAQSHGVSPSISREIGSRLVRVVERAREAALFFAPSSSARRVSLVASCLSLSLLLTFSCFVAHFFVVAREERRD